MVFCDRSRVCRGLFASLPESWGGGGSLTKSLDTKLRLCVAAVLLLTAGLIIFRDPPVLSADIYDAPAVEGFFSALAKVDRARGAGPGGLQQHQHLLKDDDPSASSSSDPCWQPASSVLVTVANFHHVGLALMQFRHLSERRTGGCSLTRAVVAVDTFVSDLCGDMGFRHCVLGTRSNVGASDYKRSSYHALTYLKWRVARSALLSFENVFFFDSDVVVLKNPWPPIAGIVASGQYDLMHQAEGLEKPGTCLSEINGGQLYITRGAVPLVDCVLGSERTGPSRVLDQDFVRPCATAVRARTCALNQSLFNGFCVHHRLKEARVLDVVAFHAHCLGTFHHKRAAMNAMLAAVEAAQADPALNSKLDKVRWLGVRNVHGVYVVPPTNRRAKSGGTSGSGGVVVGVVGDQEQVDEACTETVEWACRRKGNMSRIPELARG